MTERFNPKRTRPWLLAAAVALLAIAAPAHAATPAEGLWGGRTSAALPVSFEVKEGQVENARFSFLWGFCGAFESALPNVDPVDPEGNWSFLDGRGPRIDATFLGPERAEGTVAAPSRELPGCPGTESTFVAMPGPVPPAPPVLINDGRGHLERRPHRIDVAAGPRYFYALHWTAIGLNFARAHGVAFIHRGTHTLRRRAEVTLADPFTMDGYRTFEALVYHVTGRLPAHFGQWGKTVPRIEKAAPPAGDARPGRGR